MLLYERWLLADLFYQKEIRIENRHLGRNLWCKMGGEFEKGYDEKKHLCASVALGPFA